MNKQTHPTSRVSKICFAIKCIKQYFVQFFVCVLLQLCRSSSCLIWTDRLDWLHCFDLAATNTGREKSHWFIGQYFSKIHLGSLQPTSSIKNPAGPHVCWKLLLSKLQIKYAHCYLFRGSFIPDSPFLYFQDGFSDAALHKHGEAQRRIS